MEEFKASLKNFMNVFAEENYFYQVPNYQRPYSWDRDNCDALLNDLLESYTSAKDRKYFCGSLVLLKNESDDRFDIIDGQQRLTTFIIFLAVLRDFYADRLNDKSIAKIKDAIYGRYEPKERIKFVADISKQVLFQSILKEIRFDDEEIKSGNKYLENACCVKDYIDENFKETENINDFIDWLYEKIEFVVIEANNLDNGIKIFNVLNDRGLQLKPVNILKSSMMSELNEEDRRIFASSWDNIFKKLKEDDDEIDKVLNYYAFYAISEKPHQRYDRVLIEEFKRNSDTTILDEICEIEKFADAYVDIVSKQNKDIYLLEYLRWQYWKPILITGAYVKYGESNLDDLASILVAYYYQNWIAGAAISRVTATSFAIIKTVKEKGNIAEIRRLCEQNLNKYSTTDNFKKNLNNSVDEESWIKPVLLLLEYGRQDESKVNFIELNNKVHLEHVLPKSIGDTKWSDNFDEDAHQKFVHNLGNLTLLSMKKNEQGKNSSFEKKKEIYGNKDKHITNFAITQDILLNSAWTKTGIQKRQKEMKELICQKIDIFG